MRVAVLGASGFVGTAVMRELLGQGIDAHAFARSTGNSWGLTRVGIPVNLTDIRDKTALVAALAGYDAVVNCTRGGNDAMLGGLRNMLHAVEANGCSRFVHLGSMAIHGDYPAAEASSETASPAPSSGYGRLKLEQDRIVEDFAARGKATAIILTPPNIGGPESDFLMIVADAIARGRLLMAEGAHVCSMCDVDNLALAVRLALDRGKSGARYFVTDGGGIDWSEVIEHLSTTTGASMPRTIDPAALKALAPPLAEPKGSLRGAAKRLLSPEVRKALSREPLLRNLFAGAKRSIQRLPGPLLARVADFASPPVSVPKRSPWGDADVRLSAQQLRDVDHSCALAAADLDYAPRFTAAASLERFARWYAFMNPLGHREGRAASQTLQR